jgi:acylphosphatase
MRARAHVIVSGRVQGVFFRAETQSMALKEGLSGWVRNMPDGRVEAVFEGKKESVDRAVEWCRHGPMLARVDDIDVRWEDEIGETSRFQVRR